jgi:hypothetical protein
MNLTSENKVNASSKAECAIPGGLKLGPKVGLTIDLPVPAKEVESGPADKDQPPTGQTEFKMKAYWGCSETIPPNQPKVIESKEMSAAMRQGMQNKDLRASMKRAMAEATNGSHAYWPGRDNRQIDKAATCPGAYTLTTNYCGGTDITFDKPQDFLAPFDLVSPGANIDFDKGIRVEWKPVPNACAYLLTAFSGKEGEMVTWTSSSDPNPPMDIQSHAISKAELEKFIKNGVLIPPDKTFCYIPAGIFKSAGSATLMAVAIGADKLQVKDAIETNVVVRSTAMAMLGGMDMGPGTDKDEPGDKSGVSKEDQPGEGGDSINETLDKANDATGTANKAKNVINRAKDIFKRR